MRECVRCCTKNVGENLLLGMTTALINTTTPWFHSRTFTVASLLLPIFMSGFLEDPWSGEICLVQTTESSGFTLALDKYCIISDNA